MNGRVLHVAAGLLALVLVATASAATFTAGPLVQASGTSPFLGCTADGGQSGTVYLNSEVEPWIDVNPANPANLVGIFQQDRWSNGGSRGLVAAVSMDGGATWTQSVVPGTTVCSGGGYQRATDPWVSFSPNGVVHQLALSFNEADFDHALLASRSTNGGLTWSAPVEVRRDTAPSVFNDKQSITADPTNSSLVYGVWDRLEFPPGKRPSVVASFRSSAFAGPIWFARSTDGGVTWEPAREIYDPGTNGQTIGNQIVVLPDGDLVNVFDLIDIGEGNLPRGTALNVAVIRSEDEGVTWGPAKQGGSGKPDPIVVGKLLTVGVLDPETGDTVRAGEIIPDIAVDRSNGSLYAVWQDSRWSGGAFDSIALSMSTDGGFTWSAPIKVNATPSGIPPGNQQAFTPSVHVSADGTVGVTYYDFRNNTSSPTLLTDYWIVHCHASCSSPASWASETRLTDAPFDLRLAPNAGGFFVGDYEGLTSVGNRFGAFFSKPHGTDPSSAFYRTAGP